MKPYLLGIALGSAVLAIAADPPPFRFLDPIARIESGTSTGVAVLRLRIDKPSTEQTAIKEPPELKDWSLPERVAARVEQAKVTELTDPADVGRTWKVELPVTGLDPANIIQRRYATVSWAKQQWPLTYQISNQPP